MKIPEVRAIPLAIPLRPASPPSPWAAEVGKQVLVRVTTDAGLAGWGESFAYGAPLAVANVVDEALAPLLMGKEALEIEARTRELHHAIMIWGRRGLAMFAVSGVTPVRPGAAPWSRRRAYRRLLIDEPVDGPPRIGRPWR